MSETILSFKNVNFEYSPLKPLVVDASFSIGQGYKVTIMGQNGSGKSTILKLINGSLKPTSGSINLKKGLVVSTAQQVITPEDRKRTVLEFFTHHCHGTSSGISARIAGALQKVGLSAPHDRLISSFSGGQQARLLLASALIGEPDVLLLDEPTNNLDVAGVEALRELILCTDKTVLVISHDEDFLNSFTDSVLYVDNHSKAVESYDGNYLFVKSEISKRIAKENADNARLAKDAQAKKDQANVFANKGGGMRKVAKKMRELAAEMEDSKVTVRKEDRTLGDFTIPFQSRDDPGTRLLTISSVNLPQYVHDRPIVLNSPVRLEHGSRVRFRGPNGAGKTTFLNSIVQREASGVDISDSAAIGYYRQDFHNLDFEMTMIDCLRAASDQKHSEQYIRTTAAHFLLYGDMMKQRIATLSEGQKGLLSFACLVLQEPAILIVDEPTNHINFRHLPALARALGSFRGALLMVSHDDDFVSKVKLDKEIDLAALKMI